MIAVGTPVVSESTRRLYLAAGLIGGLTFLYGLVFGDSLRAWQSLLVNFLFFGGLAQAGVVISAIMQVTSSRWGRALKRIAEATTAFFPISFVLLLILLAGVKAWAPWVHEPVDTKAAWLNIPFFATRQLIGFLVLTGLSLRYVYQSLRPDIGLLDETNKHQAVGFSRRLISNWRGLDQERQSSQRSQSRLAPALLIAYGWVFTLVAFDFFMSLDPHWFSTLAGGYYFIGNLLLGFAFLSVIAVWSRRRLDLTSYIGKHHLHDIGKLLFGFCILWAYMFWSQYLVIWYGDLAEETEFIYHRMHGPWAPLAWTVFATVFVIPFVVLLSRKVKTSYRALQLIAFVPFVGMWLERFILVSPSMWHGPGVPLGLTELLITCGATGLFAWCYTTFLQVFPVLPLADPRLGLVDTHPQAHTTHPE
ncbi:MAG: hypothetical protein CL484_05720 [Acidobacteria bacterium]|nr:hypothetical protein [Acidobacteriota bacterium]|tara:strand:- start:10924 stop:12180 length:1257 start_codon:yes stop_codon:yes gene_type:complete